MGKANPKHNKRTRTNKSRGAGTKNRVENGGPNIISNSNFDMGTMNTPNLSTWSGFGRKDPSKSSIGRGNLLAEKMGSLIQPICQCGLCGNTENLTRTDCCGNWICDDASNYVMFSFANTSCYRNHSRYTLCGHHHTEEHEGDWQSCPECLAGFEPEMVAWYGTNEYNFEKMRNPPKFKPTLCSKCKKRINLGEGGYTLKGDKYYCMKCGGIF